MNVPGKINKHYVTLTPAYGRDYKSAEAAQKDFLQGKDFIEAWSGKPCSISDFEELVVVTLRYSKLRKVTHATVPEKVKV
jgi:hypothetical protein